MGDAAPRFRWLPRRDDGDGRSWSTLALGCALYGSKIGYASVDPAEATAPGQYDLGTLRALLEDLRGQD